MTDQDHQEALLNAIALVRAQLNNDPEAARIISRNDPNPGLTLTMIVATTAAFAKLLADRLDWTVDEFLNKAVLGTIEAG